MCLAVYPHHVKWLPGVESLSKYRTNGLVFSFLSETHEQVAPFTTCRDYLHDIVFATINKWSRCYYESYETFMPKPSMSKIRIIVTNTSNSQTPCLTAKALKFINKIEDALSFETKSTLFKVPNCPIAFSDVGVFVYTGDADWMLSPSLISLYALAIRVGFSAIDDEPFDKTIKDIIKGDLQPFFYADRDICDYSYSGIQRLIKEGYRNVFGSNIEKNYPSSACGATHSNFGIAEMSKASPKGYVPHWYNQDKNVKG